MANKPAKSGALGNEKLLTIINSISDGVMAVDMDMRITFFNRAAEKITGVKAKTAIGEECHKIFRTNICSENCPLRETMRTGKPVVNQFVCMNNDKDQRVPISISTAVLQDEQGRIVGGAESFRDLSLVETLRKELENSYTFEDMIGRSQTMKALFDLLPVIAESDSTVLIEGESGTGKELIARAIHHSSPRRNKPMITINSGAVPDTLLESELFGYKAGAFTDAKKEKKGRLALAAGGTLFLDEIGELSTTLQVKILRVLQNRIYEPLGATKSEKADVRFIAATNKDLAEMVKSGGFREDLFYRLNVFRIKVPPLRERKDDIPVLIDHFVGKFNLLKRKDISGVSPDSLKILLNYNYPGNVRELENIIEHAFVLCPSGIIKPEHLPDYLDEKRRIPVVEIAETMEEMETLFIIASLKRNNWNRKDTAKELGVNVSTLYRKMKKLHITCPNKK